MANLLLFIHLFLVFIFPLWNAEKEGARPRLKFSRDAPVCGPTRASNKMGVTPIPCRSRYPLFLPPSGMEIRGCCTLSYGIAASPLFARDRAMATARTLRRVRGNNKAGSTSSFQQRRICHIITIVTNCDYFWNRGLRGRDYWANQK